MWPHWAWILLLLLLTEFSESVDWCRLRCPNGQLHTMCGQEGGSTRRQCRNMINTMTPAKRADLLHWHNSYRNSIAEGQYGVTGTDIPGVANMRQMTYYDDLETIAQKWAEQCIPAHDDCRTTPRFEGDKGFNSGQNFGTQKSDLKIPSDEMTWFNFLQWANERINVPAAELSRFGQTNGNQQETWSHWTTLVWADSHTLGCAEVVYEVGGLFERTTFCNYAPGGNLKGRKAFEMGPACSRCPSGTSCRADSNYTSLCALSEDPMVREDFITSSRFVSYFDTGIALPSSSEELADTLSHSWRSPRKRKGKVRKKPFHGERVYQNVKKHKEPGQHEPLPEKHDEPGAHELESTSHKELGKHKPNKPSKHVEPGEHETVLEKHEEPGKHEPVPVKHMEPGKHEDMPLKHVEPGRHEEIDPEAGSTEHKEPGWHEPLPKKHREPGDHGPFPVKHVEPDKHEVAPRKKHKEPGMHEPRKPRKHSEPEMENHKEPGEHEPEPEEHDEPGEHEEANVIIFEGGRAVLETVAPAETAAADGAKPASAPAAAASDAGSRQKSPKNGEQPAYPNLPSISPLPGEAESPNLSNMGAVGQREKNGTSKATHSTSGCENERMMKRDGLVVISIVIFGLIYAWFGGMV